MTKETEILGKNVIITGFRTVKVEKPQVLLERLQEKIQSAHVQLLDAKNVAGWEHLYFAALNAIRAYEVGSNISKNLEVEALLYASGQHQIKRAVEMLGIKPDTSEMAVLIISDTKAGAQEALKAVSELLRGKICDDVLGLNDEKIKIIKEVFKISDLEIEAALRGGDLERALINLVIEHVALLAVRR